MELPLSELQGHLSEMVVETKIPGRQAARSAIHHLRRAWKIQDIDPEMAVFRAITAEEEAARAIFHSLQFRKYPGSEKLNWRQHPHKAAVAPFLEIIFIFASKISNLDFHGHLDRQGDRPILELGIKFPHRTGDGKYGYPVPPLDFRLTEHGQDPLLSG